MILDFIQAELQKLITHHIGNKFRDEKFHLSSELTSFSKDTRDFLLKYFLLPIRIEEVYSFTHPINLDLNVIFSVVSSIFSNQNKFISSSKNIGKLLYEVSMHPKIKEGELNVAYFSNVVLDGKVVEAIGIFKSETDVPFLKMKNQQTKFNINHDYGFEIKGIDKGCIVFNSDQQTGYKVLLIDNSNKTAGAQYWKDDFLKVKPIATEFYQTNEFLGIAKQFVTKQLSEEFEVTKADQIDLLNRSVEYFKRHDSFEKGEFEKEVLQDPRIIKSFQNFDSTYRNENDLELTDNFDISPQAVKKQARIFKSVLKLDMNFHIYIHGDKDLIERGFDQEKGMNFYKVYFRDEH